MDTKVRVRFAPSPTGHLHIGGLRTALFNWLFARKMGGSFLVRIEDTDLERSETRYTESIIGSLQWMAIEADEPLVIQSERLAVHAKAIEYLIQHGKAYRCFCTQEELQKRLPKIEGKEDLFSKYDGLCRQSSRSKEGSYVVRFALPDDVHEVSFDDAIRGTIAVLLTQLDDFIIARSDGSPVYNFVVVVDDHDMAITHVIRGEDHISNTHKQILLYRALGYTEPQFAHLPLILGPSGDRLSKRDAATSVLEYRTQGYLPDALLNYLVRLGWSHGDQELFSRDEMVQLFSFDAIGKKGAIFDMQKLAWVNSVYLKAMNNEQIVQYAQANVDATVPERWPLWNSKQVGAVVGLYKERVTTVHELMNTVDGVYYPPTNYDKQQVSQLVNDEVQTALTLLAQRLELLSDFSVELVAHEVKDLCTTRSMSLAMLAKPLRLALLGVTASPGIFEVMAILHKNETVKRLQRFLSEIR